VQGQVKFNRVPEKVPDKVWEVLVTWCRLGSSGFRRRFRRRSRRLFGAEPVKFIRVPDREGSGEGLGGFGAEPGPTGFGRRFRRKSRRLWCRARSGSTGRRRFRTRSGRFWCRLGSSGFRRRFRRRSRRLWCRACQVHQGSREGSGEGLGGLGAEPSATGFRRRFRRKFGEGLGGFGAKPGQVQQGSEEGSGEGLGGFGAEPVKFIRVPKKVQEKV